MFYFLYELYIESFHFGSLIDHWTDEAFKIPGTSRQMFLLIEKKDTHLIGRSYKRLFHFWNWYRFSYSLLFY